MKSFLRLLGLVAVLSMAVAVSFVAYDYFKTRGVFPPKTFIGRVEVSGFSQNEAVARLKTFSVAAIFTPEVTLLAGERPFSFPPERLGIYLRLEETVDNAFRVTHRRNYIKELKERLTNDLVVAPLFLSVDEDLLRVVLEALAPEIASEPQNATLTYIEETGGYHIAKEIPGRRLNVDKSLETIKAALANQQTALPLAIDYTQPRITESILRLHPPVYRLSAFTTYYGSHDSPNRIHNIKLIASWIDNTILLPGEKYSLADSIGEFTPERGFKEAFVIMSGELVPQLGGGTCQIGTTFYNAIQLADIKVLQRRNHSFYFNIYPLGRDATVYPHQVDFKFENDTGYPIMIKTVANNAKLSFRIYGTPTSKEVTFTAPAVYGLSASGYVPMSLRQVIGLDVPFRTVLKRIVKDASGKIIKEEEVKSFYKLYGEKTNVPIRRPEPR